MKHRANLLNIAIILLFVLTACDLTRNVPTGRYLLRSNTIEVKDNAAIDKYELGLIVRQQPNQRNFYINFKLRIYNSIDSARVAHKRELKYQAFEQKQNRKKDKVAKENTKRNAKAFERGDSTFILKEFHELDFSKVLWKEKVKYKFGQKPIVFDTILYQKSIEQLGFYLRKKGYYYGQVKGGLKLNKKKRFAYSSYLINTGPQYLIDSVQYLGAKLLRDKHSAFVKKQIDQTGRHPLIGQPFDTDYLNDYRDQVAKYFRDDQVYKFTSSSISFSADTNRQTMRVRLLVQFDDRFISSEVKKDSLIRVPYVEMSISSVYFHLSDTISLGNSFTQLMKEQQLSLYDPIAPQFLRTTNSFTYDEIQYSKKQLKEKRVLAGTTNPFRKVTVTYNGEEPWVKPSILELQNYLENDNKYKEYYLDRSYRSIVQLGVFSSVKPILIEQPGNKLAVHYFLEPAKKQTYGFDPKFTSSTGLLGANASFNYTNKNINKGAGKMTFSFGGGFESQPLVFQDQSGQTVGAGKGRTFNTFEFGPSLKFDLPGLFPTPVTMLGKRQKPRTVLTTAYNIEKRSIFDRSVFQLNYMWKFLVGKTQVFQMGLPGASVIKYVSIKKSDAFQAQLNQINDVFLNARYNNQFIWQDFKFSYEYNNKEKDLKDGNERKSLRNTSVYFNSTFDAAGNLLYQFKARQDTLNGQYLLRNQPYSQFVRLDNQFIMSKRVLSGSSVHLKLTAGAGLPYKNSKTAMPYDYSFFGGGSNDNRGWRARALGPGAYKYHLDTNRLATQIADIRFAGSLEYRFSLGSTVKGAIFTDFGNIWTYREDLSRMGSQFHWNTFVPQIAISSGLGLRMDLAYFVIRLDVGFPIYNPAFSNGAKWVFQEMGTRQTYYQEGMDHFNMNLDQVKKIMPKPFLPNYLNFGIGYPF
jgi:hypothetical protein